MNFDLSENQTLFRDTVERFVAAEDVPFRHKARHAAGGYDRARWADMAELGLIAIAASEAQGGLGGSDLDCAIVAQALGKGVAVEPWLECGYLPLRLLDDAPGLVDGSAVYAFAFAEAGTRYELDARAVTAKPSGDSHIVSGEKRFVLGGAAADRLIVTAKLGDETQLFVIDRTHADCRTYAVADGSLATVSIFRDSPATLLPGGMARIRAAVEDVMLMASAEMVGLAQRLFAETLSYVKTREQFGQPIGRFQVIQHRMVDNYARCEELQSALYRALLMPGTDRWAARSGLKAQVTDIATLVAQDAVQFHGGMGMTDELIIGHAMKRIMVLGKLFGDPATGYAAFAKAA
jgi:alkylation response protein AidB-like acyl-CoA dehydrogenase